MSAAEAEIAWIDLETTGLTVPEGHWPLQIAAIITDRQFNELGVFESKIFYAKDNIHRLKELANDYVIDMHEKTGLWDQLSDETNPRLLELDELLYEWLVSFQSEALRLRFGGNSIFLDREFMRAYLPKSYSHLSYRSIDMTSVEEFFQFTEGRAPFEKKLTHNALEDIRESIAQAHYHKNLNKPF